MPSVEKTRADGIGGDRDSRPRHADQDRIKPPVYIWGSGQDRTGTHTELPHLEGNHFRDLISNADSMAPMRREAQSY